MKVFPILQVDQTNGPQLSSIPWAMIEPHRKQALNNHSQTLERLAERGGLSEAECLLVLEDRPLFEGRDRNTFNEAQRRVWNGELARRVRQWEATQ
jgi:hypothetical protein